MKSNERDIKKKNKLEAIRHIIIYRRTNLEYLVIMHTFENVNLREPQSLKCDCNKRNCYKINIRSSLLFR